MQNYSFPNPVSNTLYPAAVYLPLCRFIYKTSTSATLRHMMDCERAEIIQVKHSASPEYILLTIPGINIFQFLPGHLCQMINQSHLRCLPVLHHKAREKSGNM